MSVQEQINRLEAAKQDIAAAIEQKGVTVPEASTLDTYGDYISQIQASGGGGKRTCRIVVGTSAAGWTADDCDYLCDGTSDESEINAAIAALPTGGGEIVLLDGTYNLSAGVTIAKDDVTLRGNGMNTILVANLTLPNGASAFVINGIRNTIKDMYIKRQSNNLGKSLINIKGGYNTIQNIYFYATGVTSVIYATATLYNSLIANNVFYSSRIAITFGSEAQNYRNTITGNYFYSSQNCIEISETTEKTIITNNIMESFGTAAVTNFGEHIVVSNNIMTSGTTLMAAIMISGKYYTIEGNNIQLTGGARYSIYVMSGSENVTVVGNTISGPPVIDNGLNSLVDNNLCDQM